MRWESEEYRMRPVGHIRTEFGSKFGVPRQSGLVPELRGRVVLAEPYRCADALRGLEGFSYVWLLWLFSQAPEGATFSPTVRPPRLGGNTRVGVFASRSPFRPNRIGLSSVALEGIDWDDPQGPVLLVRGADLMDGTPILDIKPYVPYADSHPDAAEGFTAQGARRVACVIPPELLEKVPPRHRAALRGVLEQDPRPSYQDDPERVYGFSFAGQEIRFRVQNGVLTVTEIG